MNLLFTPDWFLGRDILIEIFSFVVLSVFFILCLRNYKLNRNKKTLYLGVGLLFIALAQAAMAATKFAIFYNTSVTSSIGDFIIQTKVVSSVQIIYGISFFLFRMFTLLGLYILYRLPTKKNLVGDFLLAFYFIIISAVLGREFYYLFHATALVLLGLITYNYYLLYKQNRFVNTKILTFAFGLLALSQFLFMLSQLEVVYVIGNLIELVSYLIVLFLIFKILKHGQKTKPNGYNLRYARHHTGKRWRN
ncbi:MAG TPA: hypothetical protein PLK34_02770 [Candidatus Pacearchaeota archaeon]|nr:hypothetical protein [Candidatus Pacearchaeota archaeon]